MKVKDKMEIKRAIIIFDDNDEIKNQDKVSKEPTHSVQVRENLYRQLKVSAFQKNMKIIDLVEKLVKDGMKVNHY